MHIGRLFAVFIVVALLVIAFGTHTPLTWIPTQVAPASAIADDATKATPRTTNEVRNLRSQMPSSKNSSRSSATTSVALCFFGLVKDVDADLVSALNESLVTPLRRAGYLTIDAFLHTYTADHYDNTFNKESSKNTFNQRASIASLQRLLPSLTVTWSAMQDADTAFPIEAYLSAGDPWPFNPNQSLRYYLRQQYSLLRVTEMWSGNPALAASWLPGAASSTKTPSTPVVTVPGASSPYSAVVYVRPDLQMLSVLNMDAFDAVIGAATVARSRIDAMGVDGNGESSLQRQHRLLEHPWSPTTTKSRGKPTDAEHVAAEGPGGGGVVSFDKTLPSVPRTTTSTPMHIAVPTLEWGGINDRFAFGGPEAMFWYGARGLSLHYYVNILRMRPHAERYLRHYLCALGAVVHMVPHWTARRRVDGTLSDDDALTWRSKYYNKRAAVWNKWQLGRPLDRYGRGGQRHCTVVSLWGYEAFDAATTRSAKFRKT